MGKLHKLKRSLRLHPEWFGIDPAKKHWIRGAKYRKVIQPGKRNRWDRRPDDQRWEPCWLWKKSYGGFVRKVLRERYGVG